MSRFATLLHREWMQHHRGYLVLAVAPPVLLLIVLAFSQSAIQIHPSLPPAVMAMSIGAVTAIVLAVGWIAMAFQMPGLARRDQQDRSIEFWLSLPVGHAPAIGATLLFHALLMPLMALAIGWAFSHVVGLVLVAMVGGASAWLQLPWGVLLADGVVLMLRLALGITLATLWVSPVIGVLMVASAGLKRWGLPAVIALSVVFGAVIRQIFGVTNIVGNTVRDIGQHALFALVPFTHGEVRVGEDGSGLPELLAAFPRLAGESALAALRDLATADFLGVMAVSAACFAALVALRRRNG